MMVHRLGCFSLPDILNAYFVHTQYRIRVNLLIADLVQYSGDYVVVALYLTKVK